MRRSYQSNFFNGSIKLGQKITRPVILQEQSIYLNRIWHQDVDLNYSADLHAKFNSDAMNGIQIMARLTRNGILCASTCSSFLVYRVSESGWTETLAATITPTISNMMITAYVSQATLGANELSGMETYSIEAVITRKRKVFRKKVWFNHLGCFDSINRLRQYSDQLNILKLDE